MYILNQNRGFFYQRHHRQEVSCATWVQRIQEKAKCLPSKDDFTSRVSDHTDHSHYVYYVLCCPPGGGPRLDRQARIQFVRINTGEKPWNTKLEPWKTNLEPWKTMKTDLEQWKTNVEPWKTMKTNLEPWKTMKTDLEPWETNLEPKP